MAIAKHTVNILQCTTILATFECFVSPLLLPDSLPNELKTLDIISDITTDPFAKSMVATDFGNLSTSFPAAVFNPSSLNDIATLIRFSYDSPRPFTISPRGVGHSINGQAFAPDGIVINMLSLARGNDNSRITVIDSPVPYADVAGEQHWINVLNATLKHFGI